MANIRKKSAVIAIDLQKEFLTPVGFLKKNYISSQPLSTHVAEFISAYRCLDSSQPVIWVQAEYNYGKEKEETRPFINRPKIPSFSQYSESPPNTDFLASGHCNYKSPTLLKKRNCCVQESLIEFTDEVKKMQLPSDKILTKNFYSAFNQTELHSYLEETEITHIYLVGLMTNVCVLSTATDGFFLGYQVTVISDCTAATNQVRHTSALKAIDTWYGKVKSSSQIISEYHFRNKMSLMKTPWLNLASGDSGVFYNVLTPLLAKNLFFKVKYELEKHGYWDKMYIGGNAVSRLICTMGDEGVIYRNPSDTIPILRPWHPLILQIRDEMEAYFGIPFNQVKIQIYPDLESYISNHSDKTLDIKYGTPVAVNLNLGASRLFVLTKKSHTKGIPREKIPIMFEDNSVIYLGWESNKHYLHGVPKMKVKHSFTSSMANSFFSKEKMEVPKAKYSRKEQFNEKSLSTLKKYNELIYGNQRISMVFRQIATFQDANGFIWGQGSTCKTREELEKKKLDGFTHDSYDAKSQALAMKKAFTEEKKSNFDRKKHYDKGFDVKDFSALTKDSYLLKGKIASSGKITVDE